MLPPITWTNYLLVVLLLATAYYVFVGVRFWSHEIKSLLSSRFKAQKEIAPTKPHCSAPATPGNVRHQHHQVYFIWSVAATTTTTTTTTIGHHHYNHH